MRNFCVSLNCVDCVKWCSHRRCTCTICNTQSFCVLTTPKQPARKIKQTNGNERKSNQSKKAHLFTFPIVEMQREDAEKNPTNTQFCLTNIHNASSSLRCLPLVCNTWFRDKRFLHYIQTHFGIAMSVCRRVECAMRKLVTERVTWPCKRNQMNWSIAPKGVAIQWTDNLETAKQR